MKKKIIGSIPAIAVVLILVFIVYYRAVPDEYVPATDEIALHIQLDTDIYIADEGLKQIFTPFYRVDKSWNRNRDLGLYITLCPFHHVLLKVS